MNRPRIFVSCGSNGGKRGWLCCPGFFNRTPTTCGAIIILTNPSLSVHSSHRPRSPTLPFLFSQRNRDDRPLSYQIPPVARFLLFPLWKELGDSKRNERGGQRTRHTASTPLACFRGSSCPGFVPSTERLSSFYWPRRRVTLARNTRRQAPLFLFRFLLSTIVVCRHTRT